MYSPTCYVQLSAVEKTKQERRAGLAIASPGLPGSTLASNLLQPPDLRSETHLLPLPLILPLSHRFFPEQLAESFLKGKSHHIIPLLQKLQGLPRVFGCGNSRTCRVHSFQGWLPVTRFLTVHLAHLHPLQPPLGLGVHPVGLAAGHLSYWSLYSEHPVL